MTALTNPFRNSWAPDVKQLIERSLAAASVKVSKERFEDSPVEIARQKEGLRIKELGSHLNDAILSVTNSFPGMYALQPVYKELADALFGYSNIEDSKFALRRAAKKIKEFQMHYLRKLEYERHTQNMRKLRKEAFGRMIGTVKQNRKHITLLHDAGRTLRRLPNFEAAPTVIIAGLPNVGKTSLLKAITGSDPQISPYPFTTKGLMLGYADLGQRIQFIDTPGLLDRPLAKRNKIELQGIAVLKHLANLIVYVFDISETAGYTIEQQDNLLKELRKLFKVTIITIANKSDIIGGHSASEVDSMPVSCETRQGVKELKRLISEELQK